MDDFDRAIASSNSLFALLDRNPPPLPPTNWFAFFQKLLWTKDIIVGFPQPNDDSVYPIMLIERLCRHYANKTPGASSPFTGDFIREAITRKDRNGWIQALVENKLYFPFNPNVTMFTVTSINNMTVDRLKEELRARGKSLTGNKDVLIARLADLTCLTPFEESIRQRNKVAYQLIKKNLQGFDMKILLKLENLNSLFLGVAELDDNVDVLLFLIREHKLLETDFFTRVHRFSVPFVGTIFQNLGTASTAIRAFVLKHVVYYLLKNRNAQTKFSTLTGMKTPIESYRLPYAFHEGESTTCFFECQLGSSSPFWMAGSGAQYFVGITLGDEEKDYLYFIPGRNMFVCVDEAAHTIGGTASAGASASPIMPASSFPTGPRSTAAQLTVGIALSLSPTTPSFTVYVNGETIGSAPKHWLVKLIERKKPFNLTICAIQQQSSKPNEKTVADCVLNFGHSPFVTPRPLWTGFQSVVDITGKFMPKRLQYREEENRDTARYADNVQLLNALSHKKWVELTIPQQEVYPYDWIDVVRSGDMPLIQAVLREFAYCASDLVYFLDSKSCPAIDLAPEDVKFELKKAVTFLGRYESIEWIHSSETSLVGTAMDIELQSRVALKFLRYQMNYDQEINNRKHYALDSSYVINVIANYDTENSPDFEADTKIRTHGCADPSQPFSFCIVMPACARNLLTILQQENIAKKNFDRIQGIFRKIVYGVHHLHSKHILHGDLKPLNIMRTYESLDSYVLIDLDSSVNIAEASARVHKGSSAYAPPERLQWDEGQQRIVLRSDLIPDRAYDLWALGAVLYFMCAAESLFPNAYDELSSPELLELFEWTDATKFAKLAKLPQDNDLQMLAKNLIGALLTKDVKERMTMEKLLRHPFVNDQHHQEQSFGNPVSDQQQQLQAIQQAIEEIRLSSRKQLHLLNIVNERTKRIEDLSDQTLVQLRSTERILLRGIYEATDIHVPTCFIIVNQKLTPLDQWKNQQQASITAEKALITKASAWLTALSKLSDAVMDPKQSLTHAVTTAWNVFQNETLYFYLVDEFTLEPIIPDNEDSVYIKIDKPSKQVVQKLLPFLKVSLKAVSVLNEVSGVARLFGYPTPYLSPEIKNQASAFIDRLESGSSVGMFSTIQAVVDEVDATASASAASVTQRPPSTLSKSEIKNVRGKALRELQQFFDVHDPQYDFCALRRVCTPDGFSCWTTEENVQKMEMNMDPPHTKKKHSQHDQLQQEEEHVKRTTATSSSSVVRSTVATNVTMAEESKHSVDIEEGGGSGGSWNPLIQMTKTNQESPPMVNSAATEQKIDQIIVAVEGLQKQMTKLNKKQDTLSEKYDQGSRGGCVIN